MEIQYMPNILQEQSVKAGVWVGIIQYLSFPAQNLQCVKECPQEAQHNYAFIMRNGTNTKLLITHWKKSKHLMDLCTGEFSFSSYYCAFILQYCNH